MRSDSIHARPQLIRRQTGFRGTRVALATGVLVAAARLTSGQVTEYYHLDGIGSVRAVTDQSRNDHRSSEHDQAESPRPPALEPLRLRTEKPPALRRSGWPGLARVHWRTDHLVRRRSRRSQLTFGHLSGEIRAARTADACQSGRAGLWSCS